MSEFVDRCRAEWSRLRVPDAVANEMAADLEADLAEAAAEGGTPEDVLGRSAFDPPSFAAAWAAERGVIPSAPRSHRRLRVLATIALPAAIAVTGAVLALVAAPSGSARVALPHPVLRLSFVHRNRPVRPPYRIAVLRTPRYVVRPDRGNTTLRMTGIVLLAAGLAGLVGAALYWPLRS
jgi:2-methylaconitate cis-trans-isomerase PrpF